MTYVELLLNTTDAFQNATKQCLTIVGLLETKKGTTHTFNCLLT